MLKLRVQDLRLRGRGFTLYPAAEENGVKSGLMDFLVGVIYTKLGLCSGDYEREEQIKKENPNILDILEEEDFNDISSYEGYSIEDLINNNLLSQEGNKLVLTKKSITILQRASEIQKQKDEEGFSYCPCKNY